MAQSLLTIRLARPHDAEAVASVHDLSWREAYRLNARRLDGLLVWSLTANDRACRFYDAMGGRKVRRMVERFGDVPLERVGFGWA